MFKLLVPIPKEIFIAVSGGIDSMVVLDFCMIFKKQITVLNFDHGTEFGKTSTEFVTDFCKRKGIPLVKGKIQSDTDFKNGSKENIWRSCRYEFFKTSSDTNGKIITAHHLNDAIETWIFTSLHGNPFLIPPKRDNFIRPFLLSEKALFIEWAKNKKVPYLNDPSNTDSQYMRNLIRHDIVPNALRVNPGLPKVIRKKYLELEKL